MSDSDEDYETDEEVEHAEDEALDDADGDDHDHEDSDRMRHLVPVDGFHDQAGAMIRTLLRDPSRHDELVPFTLAYLETATSDEGQVRRATHALCCALDTLASDNEAATTYLAGYVHGLLNPGTLFDMPAADPEAYDVLEPHDPRFLQAIADNEHEGSMSPVRTAEALVMHNLLCGDVDDNDFFFYHYHESAWRNRPPLAVVEIVLDKCTTAWPHEYNPWWAHWGNTDDIMPLECVLSRKSTLSHPGGYAVFAWLLERGTTEHERNRVLMNLSKTYVRTAALEDDHNGADEANSEGDVWFMTLEAVAVRLKAVMLAMAQVEPVNMLREFFDIFLHDSWINFYVMRTRDVRNEVAGEAAWQRVRSHANGLIDLSILIDSLGATTVPALHPKLSGAGAVLARLDGDRAVTRTLRDVMWQMARVGAGSL